jgi:uncharacterized protein YdhG (YjbR/CyaY superfamily)
VNGENIMAKTDYKNANEYLATFSPETRKILETVRKAIRDAVPGAEEVISYQIPAFKKDGAWIFYYSGYKGHYALACPPPFAAFKAFAKELAPYKKSTSAVQFPYDQPVPVELIAKMSKHQAEQAGAGGSARRPAARTAKPAKKAAPKSPKAAGKAAPKASKAPAKKSVKSAAQSASKAAKR